MSTDLTTLGSSAKDFLTRQEKTVGAIATTALGAVGVFILYTALPFISSLLGMAISVVGQVMVLGGMLFVAVIVLTLLMQPRIWTEIWHLQRRFTRWFSNMAMKADPFGRMRAFANEFLQEQWNKFNDASVRIEDQLNQKRTKIGKLEADLNGGQGSEGQTTGFNKAVETLKSRHFKKNRWDTDENQNTFRLLAQRIQFTENSLNKLRKDEVKLSMLVKIIDKWRSNFGFEIETTRMTADYLEEDFRQADATAGALEAASSVFGNGDMAQADKEVRAYIEKLTSGRIARAEVLMKQIPELTSIGDLRGDVAEDEIMRRLRDLDSAADQATTEVEEDRKLLTSGDTGKIAQAIKTATKEPVPVRRYLGPSKS